MVSIFIETNHTHKKSFLSYQVTLFIQVILMRSRSYFQEKQSDDHTASLKETQRLKEEATTDNMADLIREKSKMGDAKGARKVSQKSMVCDSGRLTSPIITIRDYVIFCRAQSMSMSLVLTIVKLQCTKLVVCRSGSASFLPVGGCRLALIMGRMGAVLKNPGPHIIRSYLLRSFLTDIIGQLSK